MYQVFLDKILLPIAPESIVTTVNNQNETVNLINEGEVNIIKQAGLTDISFDFLLPNQKYPFATYSAGFVSSWAILKQLESLKANKKPFQLIIVRLVGSNNFSVANIGGSFYTNITVTIEDYSISESVEYGNDIMVSIQLKEYKPYGTKKYDANGNVVKVRN